MSRSMTTFLATHPIAAGAAGFVTFVFGLRTLLWRALPRERRCETCEAQGEARRVVRGSYWFEIPVLAAGLSIGLIVHLVLMFAVLVFLWRTFGAYLVCARCGSERLSKPGSPLQEPS